MSRTIKQKKTGGKAIAKSCRNNTCNSYTMKPNTPFSIRIPAFHGRNNGGCPVCEGNRLHKHNKKLIAYSLNTIKER
jgi:hypothetical protein